MDDGKAMTIGLGHIEEPLGSDAYVQAEAYKTALEEASLSTDEAASLLLERSGNPHYKIDGDYYAPCAGDTSVFLLPPVFDEQAHEMRDRLLAAAGNLLVLDRYPDHFHVTLRGFGTAPVPEGDPRVAARRKDHKAAFEEKISKVLSDPRVPRSFELKPHDVALLGSRSSIAVVIRHAPATDADAAGLHRLFRAFDGIVEDEGDVPGATWHSTLAYRLTRPYTGEEASRLSRYLSDLSEEAAKLPAFKLVLEDLVYWEFSDMDDFHEVGVPAGTPVRR